MTTLPSIVAGAGADVVATGNFNAVSPAGMYGRRPSTSSGRVWGYFGGRFDDSNTVADGTVTATASTTSYVVAARSNGAVSISTSNTNFLDTANYIQVAVLVADGSNITNGSGLGVDWRPSPYGGTGGGGGGGAVSSVNGQTGAVVLDVGDLDDVDLTGLGDGDTLVYDLATTTWIPGTGGGGGATDFTDLGDVPSSYTGKEGLPVLVNDTADGLQFLEAPDSKSTGFTLALTDLGQTLRTTSATAMNVTVPPNSSVAFPLGTIIPVEQSAAGLVSFVAGAGVTIITRASLDMAGPNSLAALEKVATDTWRLTGELAGLSVGPKGYLFGCTLANNVTDSTNDIDVAGGECVDSTGVVTMALNTSMTKRLDAAWAAGTGNGGLDTGSIANTTYHVFRIRKDSDGSIDHLFSTSPTSPTMPTGYTYFRRIGSFVRASGSILGFVQDGDRFNLKTPVFDVNASPTGTSAVTRTLASLPTGASMLALVNVGVLAGTGGESAYLSDLALADLAPTSSAAPLATVAAAASTFNSVQVSVRTNTSAQIRSRCAVGTGGEALRIASLGWVDTRGRL